MGASTRLKGGCAKAKAKTRSTAAFAHRERRRHATGIVVLTVVVLLVLGVLSSTREIEFDLAWFFTDRLPVTLIVLGAMAALITAGIVMLGRAARVRREERSSTAVWTGRLLIWVTLLTPVLTGVVWLAFFSEGDY